MVPDVAEHARFFDHLVELVPAKFYYDDESARINPRHLAKAAREALKADAKSKAKIAKREKLDPDKAATTLELQRRKAQASKDHVLANGAGGDVATPSGRLDAVAGATGQPSGGQSSGPPAARGLNLQLSGGTLSRQELLERLHKKVEEARQRRKASEETAAKAKEWKQNALRDNAAAKQQQAKQQLAGSKRKSGVGEGPVGGDTAAGAKSPGHLGQAQGKSQGQSAKKARREDQAGGSSGEDPVDFKFPRIELEDGGRHGKPPGARKLSKQALLKQVEAKKAELEALGGTEEGKAKVQQSAWKAALARAGGEKVLDDPKLLRRSLKRESKRKEKHSKAWQERVASQQDAQAARQAKRKENLAARRQTKVDNKKAKREKKLLRPGFEGRKEGFITPGGSQGGK
ncbi:hypothetical protein VOLCADRAFT_121188 [Volvox carteri f. nagariensis]|uniref:Ribosomal RNA-processing protein 14/surfeit locus protein 6 C-terminal domain-containing protein n=1 Tax=Volvox carteri f. nagariensis TaxID=3068 RepID=D8U4M4_VOLCA|nr:uncharacterized protein VOLCADRAFT_121188 [Volvox carteri f. nagariensis]EFJ45299.1 hypothetical protein VOLCADRAFT_121188 [Volvox carteri f. nagariensis]|eukprot:XP_002953675.1 hypothetical protein VOLCADRAFT_121188 [Volvox carteri f. nagariensis]